MRNFRLVMAAVINEAPEPYKSMIKKQFDPLNIPLDFPSPEGADFDWEECTKILVSVFPEPIDEDWYRTIQGIFSGELNYVSPHPDTE